MRDNGSCLTKDKRGGGVAQVPCRSYARIGPLTMRAWG